MYYVSYIVRQILQLQINDMTDKEKMISVGKQIDELVKQKKQHDKASEKLQKQIGKLMQEYEVLTGKVYKKAPFKAEVQEI